MLRIKHHSNMSTKILTMLEKLTFFLRICVLLPDPKQKQNRCVCGTCRLWIVLVLFSTVHWVGLKKFFVCEEGFRETHTKRVFPFSFLGNQRKKNTPPQQSIRYTLMGKHSSEGKNKKCKFFYHKKTHLKFVNGEFLDS